MIAWSKGRTRDPSMWLWAEGELLSPPDRWNIERERLHLRCRIMAKPWCACEERNPEAATAFTPVVVPSTFCEQVRLLLELWRWATDEGHGPFARAIRDDLYTAAEWAMFAFTTDFKTVDSNVGVLDGNHGTCLGRVLQPNRHRARRTVERALAHYLLDFNSQLLGVQYQQDDETRFLDFLDEQELWAWYLELSGWVQPSDEPSDTKRDEHFLNLRSVALLFEPVMAALADTFGTDADRARVGTGTAMDPLKMFLVDRGGWRGRLWQALRENYELTTTRESASTLTIGTPGTGTPTARIEASVLLQGRLDQIDGLALHESVSGAAKEILALAAIRNFGAHRFSRDAELVHRYGGRMGRAVIYSAFFYWKVASTLG